MHLRFKPVIEDVSLEAPLASNLGRRDTTFTRELVDRHHVKAQIAGDLPQGHDLWLLGSVSLHLGRYQIPSI